MPSPPKTKPSRKSHDLLARLREYNGLSSAERRRLGDLECSVYSFLATRAKNSPSDEATILREAATIIHPLSRLIRRDRLARVK